MPLQHRQHILGAVRSLLLRESQVQPLILVSKPVTGWILRTQALLDHT